jgi:hypothetical protein
MSSPYVNGFIGISAEDKECALTLLQLRKSNTSGISLSQPTTKKSNEGLGLIKTGWYERGNKANGYESIKIPLEFNYDSEKIQIRHNSCINKDNDWVEKKIEYNKVTKILRMEGGNDRWYEYDMNDGSNQTTEVTLKCVKYITRTKQEKKPEKWSSPFPTEQYDWVIGTKENYYKLMLYLEQNY